MYERQHLIMNPAGKFHFNELELLVVEHLKSKGYIQNDKVQTADQDKVHIGNMIIELILLSNNMGLDFVDCLSAAYTARTGHKK